MSGSAAFDQAFPPCALQCVIQYPTLETACAAVTTIVACGEAACRGADLTRFETFLAEFVPLCGAAPMSFGFAATASRTAVTLNQPATVVSSSSISLFLDLLEGATSTVSGRQVRASSSTVSPTSSSVPAAAGFSTVSESNSIGLYAGVGVGIVVVVIAAIVFFVTRNRRKQAAIERLNQIPHEDLQDQHKGYDTLNDTLSINATVASPVAPPAINLHKHAEEIHSSESQKSSGKICIPSSSSWDALATPISDSSPGPVSKSSIMNAAYVTPTYPGDKKRAIVTPDGSNTQQFIVADSRPYHVGNALEILQPPVLVTLDPYKWSVAEVEAWARGLPHFGNKLGNIMLEYQINGRVLMGLTRDSMKEELGLVFGEVSQLEADIAQLRGELLVREEGSPPDYDGA
ncbi:hypothetical protein HDU78_005831 [Chytriomyces hyalinus]|nr:hypothetical protein HDU78_005831 [Chytriomyces hyalinus]